MRAYQIVPIIVIALALPASAQQSDRSLRHQIESVVSSYAENFNKQNASGIAGLYTKDGVLGQRFDGLNHIRLLRRVYMTKCG